jgi:alcohol dehydrogenase (cytochrome c)
LKDVWDIASGTMPEDNPGSLPPQEYGDILAYFLHLNAFPTGETELKGEAAAMAAIKIEKKP